MGRDFPGAVVVNARDAGSVPGLGRPWRRAWKPTPVLLPGEAHEQRSLAGYSSWGHKELYTTLECARAHTHTRMGYSPWGHKELDMTECTHTHKPCRLSNS